MASILVENPMKIPHFVLATQVSGAWWWGVLGMQHCPRLASAHCPSYPAVALGKHPGKPSCGISTEQTKVCLLFDLQWSEKKSLLLLLNIPSRVVGERHGSPGAKCGLSRKTQGLSPK